MADQQANSEVTEEIFEETDDTQPIEEAPIEEKKETLEDSKSETEEVEENKLDNEKKTETVETSTNPQELEKETFAEETPFSGETTGGAAAAAVTPIKTKKKKKIRRKKHFFSNFSAFEMTMIVLGVLISALLIAGFTYLYQEALKSNRATPKSGIIASDTDKSWMTKVVNSTSGLPAEYAVATSYVTGSSGVQVDSRATKETVEMLEALKEAVPDEDVTLALGYMSIPSLLQLKQDTINRLVNEEDLSYSEAEKQAENMVKPGTDEHSLGLLVNFAVGGQVNPDAFKTTRSYEWLKNNAWKYGYIERYPEGKDAVTLHPYDPSAFRYIGKENAEKIYESGQSLEEYNAAVALAQQQAAEQAAQEAQQAAAEQAAAEQKDTQIQEQAHQEAQEQQQATEQPAQ